MDVVVAVDGADVDVVVLVGTPIWVLVAVGVMGVLVLVGDDGMGVPVAG